MYDVHTEPDLWEAGHTQSRQFATQLPWVIERCLSLFAGKVCVAGGFLRYAMGFEDNLNDIDLFFKDEGAYSTIRAWLLSHREVSVKYESRNCTTLEIGAPGWIDPVKVQLVHRWYFTPDDHIRRFDFTNCQANLWRESENGTWRCNYAPTFKDDCVNRRLRYNAPEREEEPLGSMRRAIRFASRGWRIGATDFGLLCMRMHERLKDYDEFNLDISGFRRLAMRAGCDY